MQRRKKLAFNVAEPQLTASQWSVRRETIICSGGVCHLAGRRIKIAKKVLDAIDPAEYLLSHATIIAAVETEDGPSTEAKYQDYLIKPEYAPFINDNQDAWERKLLWSSFPTFVGADNFLEHVQLKEFSRGVILDAIPRVVEVMSKEAHKKIPVLYIDLLVATSRKNEKLCSDLLASKVDKMSMGCSLDFTICSKCGTVIVEDKDTCDCLLNSRGEMFESDDGKERKIAELCGHHSIPSSCRFTEASWVDQPAFAGAISRRVVNLDQFKNSNPKLVLKISSMLEKALKLQDYRHEINEGLVKKVAMKLDSNEVEIMTIDDVFAEVVSKAWRN